MLFYLLLIATSSFLVTAFPQNSGINTMVQADGFFFDGPASNTNQRPTSISTIPTSATSTSTSITSPSEFNSCMAICPTTLEYNPICGTDNVDYTNPGKLGCAQRCGKDVTLNHYGRCSRTAG